MRSIAKKGTLIAYVGCAVLVVAACCSCSGNLASGSSGSGSSVVPQFSLSQINNSFSAMSALKPLAAEGKGSIAVILPDSGTDAQFSKFDAPDLKKSFQMAGLKTGQYTVQTSLGGDMLRAAKSAITNGASVLIVDTRYSGFNVSIESYAKAHGVPVIDYDWLTAGGTRTYYVGFDSLKIGVLLG